MSLLSRRRWVGVVFSAALAWTLSPLAATEVNVTNVSGHQNPAAMVADPNDSTHLAIAVRDAISAAPWIYFSANTGATWTQATLPLVYASHTYGEGSQPALAVNADGTWFAAYIVDDPVTGNPTDTTVAVARSFNGLLWDPAGSPAAQCCTGLTDPQYREPAIAVDSLGCGSSYPGRLYVAWVRRTGTDSAIFVAASTDGGTTWGSPVKVNDGATGTEVLVRPRLAMGPGGVLYVAWLDSVRKKLFVDVSTNGGASFGTDNSAATVTIGCGAGDCGASLSCSGASLHGSTPDFAVDASWSARRGWLYLTYSDDLGTGNGMDVFWVRSTNGGAAWTSPARLNTDALGTGRHQYGPGISVGLSDGSLHAAWYDRRDDAGNCATNVYGVKSPDGGATWGAEEKITSVPTPTFSSTPGEGAHLAAASVDAGAWFAWADGRSGVFDTYAGFRALAAGKRVSGSIATDTIWTAANGPYNLTGDVTVETGVKLTIQAGTTLIAGSCDDQTAGADGSRVELVVKGVLDVQGTSGSPVSFQAAPSAASGSWYGLRFTSTADGSQTLLTYTTISKAQYAVALEGCSPRLDHVTVTDPGQSGLTGYTNSAASFSPTALTITGSGNSALNLYGGSGGTWKDLRVENCPGGPGTLSGGTTLLRLVGATVANCGGPSGQGLTLTAPGGTVEIIRSAFHDNGGFGLRLAGEGPRTLSENDIYGNGGAGLVGANGSSGWTNIAAYHNNIHDNAGPEASMENGSIPLDARRNWWGAAATAQMNSLGYPDNISDISDIHDNGSLRHVDYDLWKAGPVSTTGGVESHLVVPAAIPELQHRICGAAVAPEGILKVEVSVDGGSSWENATVAGAAFYYDWFPTPGTYTVLSRATDKLGTPESVPDSATVVVSTGITTSGTLLVDELWSGSVVLEGDVIVPSGLTLTVTPGTQVRAKALGDKTFSGLDPSRIELIVRGNLVVTGTAGSRATFDSARLTPLAGDWYGIRFLDTTTDAISGLTYADVDHGVQAVRLESAAPDLLHCRLRWNSQDGLSGNSGSLSKSLWRLNDVAATNNASSGFRVTAQTAVEVLDDITSMNGAQGCYLDAAGFAVTVERLTAQGNGAAGVYVNAGSTGVVVRESTVLGNGGAGISIGNGGAEARLERCAIQGNAGAGVSIGWASACTLVKNVVTLNTRGLQVSDARVVAAYNTFSGNNDLDDQGSGFHYTASAGDPSVLGMNTFDNTAPLEVGFYGARAVNARRNWWGTTTTAAMVAAGFPAPLDMVRDIQDDRALGLLDYGNWLSGAPADAGLRAANITYPATGVTLNRYNVIVTGVSYAQAGVDHVEVSTDGGSTWGVATGTEAWTYSWFPSPGSYGLQVKVVDKLLVASTPSETVTVTITQGAPTTSGPILASEIWGPGDVVLTGDVTVPLGVTLTLNPGTNVKAASLMDDRLGGLDRSRIELIVQGRLAGNGLLGTPVILTSTRATPQAWDWAGLRYEDTADDAGDILTRVQVTAAYDGIAFAGGTSSLLEVESTGNQRYGLFIYDPGGAVFPAAVSVVGGTFSYNGGGGVNFSRGASDAVATTWTFDGSIVEHNTGEGLAGVCGDCGDSFVFQGLSIIQNTLAGLHVSAPWWCGANFPLTRLSGSVVGQNGGDGASLFGETTEVFGNQFTGQTATNTVALRISRAQAASLYKNTFTGNGANLRLEPSISWATCAYNDFGATTNLYSPGVYVASGSGGGVPRFNYDAFGDAISGTIFEAGPTYGANAWGSYWGAATTAEIALNPYPANITSFKDIEDEVWRGRIDYSRNLSSPPNLAPLRLSHFLNPEDGASLSGTTFLLQGAAGADAGIDRVEVSTDGVTWNPASGTAAWTYSWSPSAGGSHTLRCRVVDRNGVTQSPPTSITVTVNLINVTTSGPLTADESWSGVIVLTGDVTVPSGITLTLQPGTVVKATPNSDDRFGGVDTSRIELIIEGRLLAAGTVSDLITLTTAAASPAQGQWYGLRFADTADSTVTLSYLQVEWGVKGISGFQASAYPDLSHCTVRQMTEEGILLYPGYNSSQPPSKGGLVVADCSVQNCASGIAMEASSYYNASWEAFTFQLLRNTVASCTSGPGIRWHTYYSTFPSVTVSDNQVSGCPGGGLKIYTWSGCCSTTLAQLNVENNTVTDSGAGIDFGWLRVTSGLVRGNTVSGGTSGLSANQYHTLRVEGNAFHGGSGTGVVFGHGQFLRNQVYGYGGDGFQLYNDAFSPDDVVLYNDIYDNGGRGVYLNSWCPNSVFHFNNITGNTLAAAYDDSANGVDARLNWWGATVTSEMDGKGYPANIVKIWDIEDDGAKGRVDYGGWLSAPAATGVTLESRFVWPSTGATLSRRNLTLRGIAYASAGINRVEVSADGGSTWNTAVGTYSWTYSFTPPAGGAYTFKSRVVPAVGLVEDPGDSVTVMVDADAPTTSGTLLHDETWSGVITLTGDVVVPNGMTLTLLPGTIVRCQPLADDMHGGIDTSRIELIIEGKLLAAGTVSDRISLTTAAASPAKGQWYGLRFTDTADSTVTLSYLQAEWGRRGISSFQMNAYPDLSHCTVRQMTEEGILLYPGYNTSLPPSKGGLTIADCTVQSCASGIVVEASSYYNAVWQTFTFQLPRNTVSSCATGPGIQWHSYYSTFPSVTISDNQVSGCPGGGLKIYTWNGCCSTTLNQLTLENNIITDSGTGLDFGYLRVLQGTIRGNSVSGGSSGLSATSYQTLRVEGNTFSGGSGTGVVFDHGQLLRNQVSGYGGDGVQLNYDTFSPDDAILYNDVRDNGGRGFYVYSWGPAPSLHFNNITNNVQDAGYNDREFGVDARRNWWGAAMTSEMVAKGYPANILKIWDIEDDVTKGRIDYSGWLSGAVNTSVSIASRFVWPAAGASLSRSVHTLKGTAYASAGIDRVEVSLDNGATWLTASGTYSWTYTWTPATSQAYTLRCRVVAVGGAVEDPGDSVAVTVTESPTTSGTLSHSEVWSGTVVLTGDVVIPAGLTLTLSPGAQILFTPWSDDRHGGIDTSRIELIVSGTLVAAGTTGSRIQLTTASLTPAKGQWYGLRYLNGASSNQSVSFCDFSWAVTAAGSSEDATGGVYPDISDCTINQMSQYGISIGANATSAKLSWALRRNTISNTGQSGIRTVLVYGASFPLNLEISGNILSSFGADGIASYCFSSQDGSRLLLAGNTVTASSPVSGATIGGAWWSYAWADATVRDNAFTTDQAVTLLSMSYVHGGTITGNVTSGGTYGIQCAFTPTTASHQIFVSGNQTSGATEVGCSITCVDYTGTNLPIVVRVEDNSFVNNPGVGLRLSSNRVATLRRNNLFGNGGYALSNQGTYGADSAVDATSNYWGATTTSEMQSQGCDANIGAIEDQRDNGSWGLVTYCNWATGGFGDQASVQLAKIGNGRVTWAPKAGLTYDLVRGSTSNLSRSAGTVYLGAVVCIAQADGDGVIDLPLGSPPPGTCWFYALRDHVTPGAYGYSSANEPQVPTSGGCP